MVSNYGLKDKIKQLKYDPVRQEITLLRKDFKALVDRSKTTYNTIENDRQEQSKEYKTLIVQINKENKAEIDKINKEHEAWRKEIDGILEKATSSSLTKAYADRKEKSKSEAIRYTKLFYGSLLGLFVVVALLILIPELIQYFFKTKLILLEAKTSSGVIIEWLINIAYKLPIILPILWLVIFISKQRSEHFRLHQEYAHKEAMTLSYLSFKEQIEKLNIKDETLKQELISALITTISSKCRRNPR